MKRLSLLTLFFAILSLALIIVLPLFPMVRYQMSEIPGLSLILVVMIVLLFAILAVWWSIKRGGLSRILGKRESIKEHPSTPVAAEAGPRNIFAHLISHRFYWHLPPVQALIIYLGCTAVIYLEPVDTPYDQLISVTAFAALAFSILNPIINLFLPRWWLNTGLFLLSFFILLIGLPATVDLIRPGSVTDLGAAGMIIAFPLFGAMCLLPLTAVLRYILFATKKSAS